MRGKFITFEGIDGSGKSTRLRMPVNELRLRGVVVITATKPDGKPPRRLLMRFSPVSILLNIENSRDSAGMCN